MSRLDLVGVSIDVGARRLIDRIDLGVDDGRFIGLVGPNGSGKTTLLKAIHRITTPVDGSILVDGRDVASMRARELARQIAVVAQETPLDIDLTVAEVVMLGRLPHQGPFARTSEDDRAVVIDALERADITHLAERPWRTLSGGEKQRVLLARALTQQGRLLVLDEATNHLDVRHQLDLLALVRSLGTTTIAALHDLNLAAEFCDEIVVISDGRLVACGPPAEVLVREVITPVFGVDVEPVRHTRTGAVRLLFSVTAPSCVEAPPAVGPSRLPAARSRRARTPQEHPVKQPRYRRLFAAIGLSLVLLTAACGDDEPADTADAAEATATGDETAAIGSDLPPVTADFSWPDTDPPAGHYPVTVESCGEPVTFDQAPTRAVVNDDNMVELMFALGLTNHMAAYAAAGPRLRLAAFADDYAAVDYLGDDYFSLEPVLGADPDFVFSGWNYGFDADGVNPEGLADLGIASYVLAESCRRVDDSLAPATIDEWYGDVRAIGDIFGVPDRAEALIAHWEQRLAVVESRIPDDAVPVPVFSYGWGQDAPGGGLGLTIVPELYRRAGAVNVFEDLLEMWGTVSWEDFVQSAPEMIVVTDYGTAGDGQTGEQKIAFLSTVDGVDTVPAVAEGRYLVLPQEAVNPGIRIVDGIEALAAELYPEEFADLVGTDGFGLAPTSD
ncbi:MAG: ATP-binding cassette domain-containing protein [Acidimicrobiales bacterium]